METGLDKTQAMTMAGLNLIQQALSIYDNDLRLVVANSRFSEMFDLPEHLVKPGASFEETIRYITERGEYGEVDDVDALVRERVDRALAFEAHYLEREREDGRWVSVEGSPLPQGGWVAVYTDITRTKRQENLLRGRSEELSDRLLKYAEDLSTANRQLESTVMALEEAKRQLTESEARTRLTTEMMPAHIAHVGPDRMYTYSNRRLNSVMPGRPLNIIGQHIRDALGADAYLAIRPQLDKAFAGTPSVFEFNDTQSSRRIRVAFTPDDEPVERRGVYILSMDITEETQTRVALQQTRRREIAAQMTSGLAHDFSNLLTIILGMQSRLQKMSLDDSAEELISATQAAAHRGGTLLNRIADMTGHRAQEVRSVRLAPFLEDLKTLALSTLPPDVRFRIENQVPDEPLLLDPGMLQDSLLNLILNAGHACGTTGNITLRAELMHDTWVQVTVSDTGPGFSDDALHHALEPFFTTKGTEGSGLGLAMVYDMTKLAGGDIKLANTVFGGQVTLRLPLRRAGIEDKTGLALLVEDNPDLRSVFRDMLTEIGHTVIEAASVDEARTLLDQVPDISLVLSDISLEGERTGVDLIRSLPRDGVPGFLMTSLPRSDPLFVQGAACAPILSKPFSREELRAFLHSR